MGTKEVGAFFQQLAVRAEKVSDRLKDLKTELPETECANADLIGGSFGMDTVSLISTPALARLKDVFGVSIAQKRVFEDRAAASTSRRLDFNNLGEADENNKWAYSLLPFLIKATKELIEKEVGANIQLVTAVKVVEHPDMAAEFLKSRIVVSFIKVKTSYRVPTFDDTIQTVQVDFGKIVVSRSTTGDSSFNCGILKIHDPVAEGGPDVGCSQDWRYALLQ